MKRILAATSFCTLVLLATCSEETKSPDGGHTPIDGGDDAGGEDMDSGDPGGDDADTEADDASGGDDPDDGSSGDGTTGGSDDGGMIGGEDDAGPEDDGGPEDDAGQPDVCDPSSAPELGKLKLETVVSGIARLVHAAQPPGSSDWWLVQQTGQIKLLRAGTSTPETTPILDLLTDGTALSKGDDERGLLGLAFARDYATSGIFYVMMTTTSGAQANRDQVRQYKKDGTTVTLQKTLLSLRLSLTNHNGGTIAVGPDNMLYVGTGDGGGACNSDQPNTPQLISADEGSLFGKILRLDPSKASPYAAAGNPFPESPLVWHYGLRNPFRFSFDRASGDLYIGDVGQESFEDVEFAKAGVKGLNFGWGAYEGNTMTCAGRALRAGSTRTPPIFSADRRTGCSGPFCDWLSVIGGVVYRGSALPQLKGVYIFGDYKGARIAGLRQCDTKTSPVAAMRKVCNPNTPKDPCFTGTAFSILNGIVEDNAGELYFVTGVIDAAGGKLLKVVAGP